VTKGCKTVSFAARRLNNGEGLGALWILDVDELGGHHGLPFGLP